MNSFSGEFTLNNIFNNVEANGNNAYAGGFVGYNISGKIASSYSTNFSTTNPAPPISVIPLAKVSVRFAVTLP